MPEFELYLSVATLNRLFVLVVYLSVGLTCYWWLFPRLLPALRWLAGGMLAAQVLVIVLSLELQPSTFFERWHWYLDQERNIPSTLASAQLALIAAVALMAAFLMRPRSAGSLLHLSGTGLLFFFLALDDYINLRAFLVHWQAVYVFLGAALATATLFLAWRARPRRRAWYICLVSGIALIAAGGFVLDSLPNACGQQGFLHIGGCLRFKAILDEILEFAGAWMTLVAALGLYSEAVPNARRRAQLAPFAISALWIGLLLHISPFIPIELTPPSQSASVQFESAVFLHGHRIKQEEDSLEISLYAATPWRHHIGLGYSIHLVDQASGDSVAGRDEEWCCQRGLPPSFVPMYEQETKVIIPAETPVNRAFWVVLTIWRRQDGEFVRQALVKSDHTRLSATQVVLGELALPGTAGEPAPASLAAFDNGFRLDAVELPPSARAGAALNLSFVWRSEAAGAEDLAQFLHFVAEEDGAWWGHDQQPLGARLPTRLWYDGLVEEEVWRIALPEDLAPAAYTVFTGLYRTDNMQRVPARDSDGELFPDARAPIGSLTID